jgi:hypothetical protein
MAAAALSGTSFCKFSTYLLTSTYSAFAMVKNSFNFPVHAAEDANARTKVRSQQPHIGAPALHMKNDVFPDLEAMSFERSIFERLPALDGHLHVVLSKRIKN